MKVLITGGSNGIGFAVTEYLAKQGIEVFVCDLKEGEFTSENIKFFKMDVTNLDEIKAVCNTLKEQGEKLDAIVNVAGIFEIDSLIEIPDEKLRKLFEVNLMGAMFVNKTFHSLLKPNGRIILTTSEVACLQPLPFNGGYTITKSALDCYAQALRQELNVIGQKVVVIRPGAFNTNLSRGSLEKTKELTEKTVLYKNQSVKFYKLVKFFMGTPSSPEKIVKTYYKAITKKHPKLVYKKRANVLLKLMNILPQGLQCSLIKNILK